ncbi:hypothetical protein CEG14_10005 [Bordetella genomosp. 1]|uniref:Uncharacterized protein n=1 Tax=Bordetella genomosp. 1 TaxID=1395607 RepID=A0A261SEI5_9BORD|nr:hypothetical protein [Bordetella genomosp. 1]MDQ8032644.1 hypothetical protein [Bordetella sp.]OZI35417.1 hypothetical protein CEG14_10005 [Bordetella genomosp. 1]
MFDTSYALSVRAIAALGRFQPPPANSGTRPGEINRASVALSVERMLAVSAAYFQIPTAH